jgi:hypothetical protein
VSSCKKGICWSSRQRTATGLSEFLRGEKKKRKKNPEKWRILCVFDDLLIDLVV